MPNIRTKMSLAVAALALLGATAIARADDALDNWPQRAGQTRPSDARTTDRTDQTVYVPSGAPAGTPERAAEDAFYNRQFGGVPN